MSAKASRETVGRKRPAFLEGFPHRLGDAWRMIRKRPGFALAVVTTLALGIGANTAVFGLIHTVILSPLPYEDSGALYSVLEQHTSGRPRVPSYPTFRDWEEQVESVGGLAFARGAPLSYQADGHSGLLLGAFVTDGFFEVLGAGAERGRILTADDFPPSAEPAVLISNRAWTRWFGSDPGVLGTVLRLDGLPFSVVGVMPSAFGYPDWGADNDLWLPITQLPPGELAALNQRGFGADSRVIVRLRGDVSRTEAQARLEAVTASLATAYPDVSAGWTRVRLDSLKDLEVGSVRLRLAMLWAAVTMVLLICCLNLANLYLVHGLSRRQEYAVRAALGADRLRLFRQVLTEALVLSSLGGLLGVVIAARATAWARDGGLSELPRINELALDWPVLGFATLVSIGTALVFALVAARRVGSASLRPEMVRGGRTSTVIAIPSWIQSAQVAITFVLLVAAWLLTASFLRLGRIDPGYDPVGLVLVQINPPSPAYDEGAAATTLYSALLAAVGAVPGVSSTVLTNHGPGGRAGLPTQASLEGIPQDSPDDIAVMYRTVSAGYFAALGIDILSGREFTGEDLAGAEGPVVVNQTLARQWGGRSPIGETIGIRKAASARPDFGEPLLGRVVGVVKDLHPSERGGQAQPVAYVPFTHSPWSQVRLLVRVTDSSAGTLEAIEEAVRAVDPAIPTSGPFVGIRRMEDVRSEQRSGERFNAGLVGAFGIVALLLAAIGMYGVVSFSVALRSREIGVRMALGASPGRVQWEVGRHVALISVNGLALGAVGATFLSRYIASLLFEVHPLDARAYAGVAWLLLMLALGAGAAPARRASRLDPAGVLYSD